MTIIGVTAGSDPLPARPELLAGLDPGLDAEGRVRREGDLSRIAPVYQSLVAEVESALRSAFGDRLHSVYLYGSVPRGTAVEGESDLDVSAVLRDQVTPADVERVLSLAAELDQGTAAVNGVGILVDPRELYLAPAQRYDGAFHISCLCTPLWGPDLAAELPEQRPTRSLAHGIGRDAEAALDRLGRALAESSVARPDLCRKAGRRVARLAFTTVLARWPGWSSDPETITAVVTAFYPDHAEELGRCVRLGWPYLGERPLVDAIDADALDLVRAAGGWWWAERQRVFASRWP